MFASGTSEAYLEPSRTSTMELFQKQLTINCFRKKAPSNMFDWVLNTPLYMHKNTAQKCLKMQFFVDKSVLRQPSDMNLLLI